MTKKQGDSKMPEKDSEIKKEKPKLDPETEKEIAEQVAFTLEQDSQLFDG